MLNEHWNKIFKKTAPDKLGWYEDNFDQTLKFTDKIDRLDDKVVFVAGVGTSLLADYLSQKCKKLILNDISSQALSLMQDKISNPQCEIIWLNCDISKELPISDDSVDVWIDRAVLHFLVNDDEIDGYFRNLNNKLTKDAFALISEFSHNGVAKCAGLELHRYSIEELISRCGENFELLNYEYYTYINPSGGERPYIYSLFKKK